MKLEKRNAFARILTADSIEAGCSSHSTLHDCLVKTGRLEGALQVAKLADPLIANSHLEPQRIGIKCFGTSRRLIRLFGTEGHTPRIAARLSSGSLLGIVVINRFVPSEYLFDCLPCRHGSHATGMTVAIKTAGKLAIRPRKVIVPRS